MVIRVVFDRETASLNVEQKRVPNGYEEMPAVGLAKFPES